MVLHLAPWPHVDGPKPFVLTEPRAVVEVQGWFAGCLLLPLAARLMHAAFLHATSKKAEEKGVTPWNHDRAAMNFVKAIAMVDILLLVWPLSMNVLAGMLHSKDLSWVLLHMHWRLFRWGLAVLSSVLVFELLQRPPRFWRFLHHGSMLLVICLMCGIPWLSLYDLLLFSAGMLLGTVVRLPPTAKIRLQMSNVSRAKESPPLFEIVECAAKIFEVSSTFSVVAAPCKTHVTT
ncbi:unnamed protein product [Symbiodinium sp. CCMP2592]|nr:unnamed protein product [Symbiodinium sp. CCMP2592]